MIAWYFTIFFSATHPTLGIPTTVGSITGIEGRGPPVDAGYYLPCAQFEPVMEAGCALIGDDVVGYCVDNPIFTGLEPDSTLACSSWALPLGFQSRGLAYD